MTTDPNRKLKVFLCHSSHDKPAVREIYTRLQAEGWIDPWLDEEKLFPGQDWDLEIEKAVEETDAVLVFLSDNSVNKEGYIQKELRFVLNMADYKPEGTNFILPMRLNECPLPRRLRSWHYVDNFPEERKEWAYERLLGSLKLRAKKLGVDATAILYGNDGKQKQGFSEKKRNEKEAPEATEKVKKSNGKEIKKAPLEIAVERAREIEKEKIRENEEERRRKAVAEKARQEKLAREKREGEEQVRLEENSEIEGRIRQVSLDTARHEDELDGLEKSLSKTKRFWITGTVVFLFLFGYIISNIEIPTTIEPTKTPVISSSETATLKLSASTSLPTSTPMPTKTSTPTEIFPSLTPTALPTAVSEKVHDFSAGVRNFRCYHYF